MCLASVLAAHSLQLPCSQRTAGKVASFKPRVPERFFGWMKGHVTQDREQRVSLVQAERTYDAELRGRFPEPPELVPETSADFGIPARRELLVV